MVRVWLHDGDASIDSREPHMTKDTSHPTLDDLQKIGVLYFHIADAAEGSESPQVKKICKERGYSYKDEVKIFPGSFPDYEVKLKTFYEEHIHDDEEIRLVTDGSGYFDVRNQDDKWVRIEANCGDLIILPSGIYHRFTLDTKNYIHAVRMFSGEPVWTSYPRPGADEREARKNYVKSLASGDFACLCHCV